ncbi:MAG: thioredoxin domain-containing protein [Minicystis sp.]
MRTPTIALALTLLSACSSPTLAPSTPRETPTAELPLPEGAPAPTLEAPSAAPKVLDGVDTDRLVDRERRIWWNLVSQLYAPCTDQAVSIAQCVEDARPCVACKPAAALLAAKVREGATPQQGQELYATRFGPAKKLVESADSPSKGPTDAPVQIQVWSDFQCPHCRVAMPVLDEMQAKYAPRVRLIHKFYPLKVHTDAEPAARAAIAAQNQGHYWEMEQLLFSHQSEQTTADLDHYATDLKLDPKRFHEDLQSPKTTKIIDRDREDADRCGLSGTPFILINGREFDTRFFHVESDLDPWIALELEIVGKGKIAKAAKAPEAPRPVVKPAVP